MDHIQNTAAFIFHSEFTEDNICPSSKARNFTETFIQYTKLVTYYMSGSCRAIYGYSMVSMGPTSNQVFSFTRQWSKSVPLALR